MKNYKNYLGIISFLTFLFFLSNCKVNAQIDYSKEIIGIWVSEDDEKWKIEFKPNGERIDYYEDELIDNSSYFITNKCGEYIRTNNELFLKWIDSDNIEICLLLNNIDTNNANKKTILSITTEKGQLETFIKE